MKNIAHIVEVVGKWGIAHNMETMILVGVASFMVGVVFMDFVSTMNKRG